MARQRAILRVVSVVVCFVFLWTNCVWAEGVWGYKLAVQSQLADVLAKARVVYTGTALHSALVTEGIKDLRVLYENQDKMREILRQKIGDEVDKLKTLIFKDDKGGIAYYTFSPEGYFYRFTTTKVVDDPFGRLIGSRMEGIEVPVNGDTYYQEIIRVSPESVSLIETSLGELYPEGLIVRLDNQSLLEEGLEKLGLDREKITEIANTIKWFLRKRINEPVASEIVDLDKYRRLEQDVDRWVPDMINEFIREIKTYLKLEEPEERKLVDILTPLKDLVVNNKKFSEWISDEDLYAIFYEILYMIFPDKQNELKESMKKLNEHALDEMRNIGEEHDLCKLLQVSMSSDSVVGEGDKLVEHPIAIDDSSILIERIESLIQKGGNILFIGGTNGAIALDLLLLQRILELGKGSVSITLAVKGKRVGRDITVEDVNSLLKKPEFGILKTFKDNELFRVIETGSETEGANLMDASEEFAESTNSADLVIAKGHINMLTMRLLGKDFFVVGLLGVKDKELLRVRHFTGLPNKREPQGIIAFIPASMETASRLDRRAVMNQQLAHFVEAMHILRGKGEDINAGIDEIRKSMERQNAPFAMFVSPDLLGTCKKSKEALGEIGQELLNNPSLTLEDAIRDYVVKNNIQGISAYTISELNQALNLSELEDIPGALGASGRKVYSIGEAANEKVPEEGFGSTRVIVSGVVLEPKKFSMDVVLGKEFDEEVISPVDIAEMDEYSDKQGVFFNFLYYITKNLIDAFNRRSNQFEIDYSFAGEYIDCLVKGKYVYPPLYNKGAVGAKEDGRLVFGRIKNSGGEVEIGGVGIKFIPFEDISKEDRAASTEAIVYTPIYEGEFLEWLESVEPDSDELKPAGKKGYYHPRRVRIPASEVTGRYQIVFINDRIIQIRQGETEIPPFGWVLSITEDKFREIEGLLEKVIARDEKEVWVPKEGAKVKLELNLPPAFQGCKTVMGGGTLLIDDKNRALFYNAVKDRDLTRIAGILDIVMGKEEGWTHVSSRQTQETDVPPTGNRQPRQIIGVTTDGEFFVFSFAGRFRISSGATYPEALYIIAKELSNGGRKIGFAFLLDDGGSVSTGVAKNGQFYCLMPVASGPSNYSGEVRKVNSVGVMVSNVAQPKKHLFPRYVVNEIERRITELTATEWGDFETASKFLEVIKGVGRYDDLKDEPVVKKELLPLTAGVLSEALGRTVTSEDVHRVVIFHEKLEQQITRLGGDIFIRPVLEKLKEYYREQNKEPDAELNNLLCGFARNYPGYLPEKQFPKIGSVNYSLTEVQQLMLLRELLVHTIVEQEIFNQPARILPFGYKDARKDRIDIEQGIVSLLIRALFGEGGEYLDVIDEDTHKVVGVKRRTQIHRDGDWHRTAHVVVMSEDGGRILVQKRKDGRKGLSVGGHVDTGEDVDSAALREIEEELGIKPNKMQMEKIGSGYKKIGRKDFKGEEGYKDDGIFYSRSKEIYNREISTLYVYRLSGDEEETLKGKVETEEVTGAGFISVHSAIEEVYDNPGDYASAFKQYFTHPMVVVYLLGMRVAYDYVDEEFAGEGGMLERLIMEDKAAKVTSNPAILGQSFERGIYEEEIKRLAQEGKTAEEIYDIISQRIVRKAAERFRGVYEGSNHRDGYVSIETNPMNADNVEETIREARRLQAIGRNIDIKIAANSQGLEVIRRALAEGINVNVTLIFPGVRYTGTEFIAPQMERVLNEVIAGYNEYKKNNNGSLDGAPQVVLSLFLSRMDTASGAVDSRLKGLYEAGKIDEETYKRLKGKAAVAATKVIYKIIKGKFIPKFKEMGLGDNQVPRLLLASTGAKGEYEETEPLRYVEPLAGKDIINAIPPTTYADLKKKGRIRPDSIEAGIGEAEDVIKELESLGIDLVQVADKLLEDGLKSFEISYRKSIGIINSIIERYSLTLDTRNLSSDTLPPEDRFIEEDFGKVKDRIEEIKKGLAEDIEKAKTDEGRRVLRKSWREWLVPWLAGVKGEVGNIMDYEYWMENNPVIKKIIETARRIREDEVEAFVHVGIGGSIIPTRAIVNPVVPSNINQVSKARRGGSPQVYYTGDSFSPELVTELLDGLEEQGILFKTKFNIISKSGTTAETIGTYLVIRARLQMRLEELKQRYEREEITDVELKKLGLTKDDITPIYIYDKPYYRTGRFFIATTGFDKTSVLYSQFHHRGRIDSELDSLKGETRYQGTKIDPFYAILPVPEGMGGRFSGFSSVGLLLLAVTTNSKLGETPKSRVKEAFRGVRQALDRVMKTPLDSQDNVAFMSAVISHIAEHVKKKVIEVLYFFDPKLADAAKLLDELYSESLQEFGRGIDVRPLVGTVDNHMAWNGIIAGPGNKLIRFVMTAGYQRQSNPFIPVGSGITGDVQAIEGLSLGEVQRQATLGTAEDATWPRRFDKAGNVVEEKPGVLNYTQILGSKTVANIADLVFTMMLETAILGKINGLEIEVKEDGTVVDLTYLQHWVEGYKKAMRRRCKDLKIKRAINLAHLDSHPFIRNLYLNMKAGRGYTVRKAADEFGVTEEDAEILLSWLSSVDRELEPEGQFKGIEMVTKDAKVIYQFLNPESIGKDIFRDYDYRSRTQGSLEFAPKRLFFMTLTWASMAMEKAQKLEIDSNRVVIARDCRMTPPDIVEAMIKAVEYSGLQAIYVSEKTPSCAASYAWAVRKHQPLMGIFLTASHLTGYNVRGVKVSIRGESGELESLTTEEIKNKSYYKLRYIIQDPNHLGLIKTEPITRITDDVEDAYDKMAAVAGLVSTGSFRSGVEVKPTLYDLAVELELAGSVLEVIDRYYEIVDLGAKPLTGLRVVVDGANTPSGKLAYNVYRALGAEVTLINGDIKELFGEHKADPSIDANLVELKKTMRDKGAHMGVAFDLDGDRGAIIIPAQEDFLTLPPDNLTEALLLFFSKRGYSKEDLNKIGIVRDVLSTRGVDEMAERIGYGAYASDTGYVNLKAMVRLIKQQGYAVPIYAERSGHAWAHVTGAFEDPIVISILFAVMGAEYMKENPQSMNPILDAFNMNTIPYKQSTRFQPIFADNILRELSGDTLNDTGWEFGMKDIPPRIIAIGRHRVIERMKEDFKPGTSFKTACGELVVSDETEFFFNEKEGLYRYAVIRFLLNGRDAGSFIFRASANDPSYVCTFETPLRERESFDSPDARVRYDSVGGVVLDYLENKGFARISGKGFDYQNKEDAEGTLNRYRNGLEEIQGSHIVREASNGPEKSIYNVRINENGALIGDKPPNGMAEEVAEYMRMTRDTLDSLEHIYGLGIYTMVDRVEIVENLGGERLYPKGRAPLASFRDGVLKVDKLLFDYGQYMLFEELEHEFLESIAGIIPGSNHVISDVISTVRNVRRFLELTQDEQEAFLGVLRGENPIDPDGEYLAMLERLRGIKGVTDSEIIASVVRYVMRTKLYENMRGQLGLPEELSARIRDLEPKLDDAMSVFNEIAKAKQGRDLINEIKKTDEVAITVVKTFTGLRISGLEKIEKELARMIGAAAKQVSNVDRFSGRLVKAENKEYILVDEERIKELHEAMGEEDYRKVKEDLERNNYFIVTELPDGVDLRDVIRLVDPVDLEKIPKGSGRLYLPMPYTRSSLYMSALVLQAGGDVKSVDVLVKGFISDLYKEILNREVSEDDLMMLFTRPWEFLPQIKSAIADLDNLRKAIVLIEKAA